MKARGRILSVATTLPRWANDETPRFVLDLAIELNQQGWDVTVLVPHAPGAAVSEILEGVCVERFRYLWPERLETLADQSGVLARLRANRWEVVKILPLVLAELASVARRLARGGYDLLHTHWILPQGLVGALSARPLRIPHVLTVHGGDVFGMGGPVMSGLKRLALGWADAVTVNSSATLRAVRELAPGLASVHRIPMGVSVAGPDRNSEPVQSLRQQLRMGNGPLLAFVGRLVPEKGVDDFLAAIAELAPVLPDVRGVIIGDGAGRAAFERRARELGLAERVAFTGWQQPESVRAHLAAADVFVGPSRRSPSGWTEAQGIVFLEALAAGTPVVASRAGGIGDVIQDGETGLLVDEGEPEQIVASVQRLVAHPDFAAGLAKRGRARVVRDFSKEATGSAFAGLFESLIRSRRAIDSQRAL
ncbi:MAG: glycosyltransferase family 4 protein [Gammaproteobacteria bacterium]|nr:glycosyltransferase family 4 protein [Gammaproteobacteria bacterium]